MSHAFVFTDFGPTACGLIIPTSPWVSVLHNCLYHARRSVPGQPDILTCFVEVKPYTLHMVVVLLTHQLQLYFPSPSETPRLLIVNSELWFLKVIFFFGQAEENPVLMGLAVLLCLFVHSRNYHVTWQKCDLPPVPKITLISAGNRAKCTPDTVVMHPLPKAGKQVSLQILGTFSALRVLLYIRTQAIVKICF